MKRWLFVLLFLSFVSVISPSFVSASFLFSDFFDKITGRATSACSDSDGGKNYEVKGTLTYGGSTYTDRCYSLTHIFEYFCPAEGSSIIIAYHLCENGCNDGVCLGAFANPETPTTPTSCSDSDGGKNYNVRGTLTYGDSVYNDVCVDVNKNIVNEGPKIFEYFCPASGSNLIGNYYDCTNGCVNGACINEGDSVAPNITINQPAGTKTSRTVSYNIAIQEGVGLDVCKYWITGNTTINNISVICSNTIDITGNFLTSADGLHKFHFFANDTSGNSNITTSDFIVDTSQTGTENQAPIAIDQSVETEENTEVSITLTGFDSDGTIVSCSIVTQPTNGVIISSVTSSVIGCSLTYTPNTDFVGSDSFTFIVTDDDGSESDEATVTITVNAAEEESGESAAPPSGILDSVVNAVAAPFVAAINFVAGLFASSSTDSVLKPGWPVNVGIDCGYECIPVTGDLDGDGIKEIVVLTIKEYEENFGFTWGDAEISIYKYDGALIKSFGIISQAIININGRIKNSYVKQTPLVGDINNDGRDEIFVIELHINTDDQSNPKIVAELNEYDINGNKLRQFGPMTVVNRIPQVYRMVLSDLDWDGNKEIIVFSSKDIKIIDSNGNIIATWDGPETNAFSAYVDNSPAIGNFDDDQDLEIVIGYNDEIRAINKDGSQVEGFYIRIEGTINTPLVIGDIDNDGNEDIIVGTMEDMLYIYNINGEILNGWPKEFDVRSAPAIGDVDNDGFLEISSMDNGKIHLFKHNGETFSGWPVISWPIFTTSGELLYGPLIIDMNGDNKPDIVNGNYAWNSQGQIIKGSPEITGFNFIMPPTIEDIDNNGKQDLIGISLDATKILSLYVWELPSSESKLQWPMQWHDPYRTSNYNITKKAQCGNNEIEGVEGCDNGTQNDIACNPTYGSSCSYCSSECQTIIIRGPYCGDGATNGNEQCDDGNVLNTDACNNLCELTYCGDGITQNPNGNGEAEQCDDTDFIGSSTCSSTCQRTQSNRKGFERFRNFFGRLFAG